jgi:hypothetical protein
MQKLIARTNFVARHDSRIHFKEVSLTICGRPIRYIWAFFVSYLDYYTFSPLVWMCCHSFIPFEEISDLAVRHGDMTLTHSRWNQSSHNLWIDSTSKRSLSLILILKCSPIFYWFCRSSTSRTFRHRAQTPIRLGVRHAPRNIHFEIEASTCCGRRIYGCYGDAEYWPWERWRVLWCQHRLGSSVCRDHVERHMVCGGIGWGGVRVELILRWASTSMTLFLVPNNTQKLTAQSSRRLKRCGMTSEFVHVRLHDFASYNLTLIWLLT